MGIPTHEECPASRWDPCTCFWDVDPRQDCKLGHLFSFGGLSAYIGHQPLPPCVCPFLSPGPPGICFVSFRASRVGDSRLNDENMFAAEGQEDRSSPVD